jgi:hypothetical protein
MTRRRADHLYREAVPTLRSPSADLRSRKAKTLIGDAEITANCAADHTWMYGHNNTLIECNNCEMKKNLGRRRRP